MPRGLLRACRTRGQVIATVPNTNWRCPQRIATRRARLLLQCKKASPGRGTYRRGSRAFHTNRRALTKGQTPARRTMLRSVPKYLQKEADMDTNSQFAAPITLPPDVDPQGIIGSFLGRMAGGFIGKHSPETPDKPPVISREPSSVG